MTLKRQARIRPAQPLGWLLLANAARARIFERDDRNGALRETADPIHPASREKEAALGGDRPGQVRKSAVQTAFAPHTAPHERERRRFAHELAQLLEHAALEQRMPGLVLMASNPFLGELKAQLGPAARALLEAAIAADFSAYQGAELERRVSDALRRQAESAEPATGP